MPDVTVRYNVASVANSIGIILELRSNLPAIVAEHLSIPIAGGTLTSSDIELNFHTYGIHDVHGKYILEIIVDANLYRQRSKNIDERTKGIKQAIALLPKFAALDLNDDDWFVWLRLSKGSFR